MIEILKYETYVDDIISGGHSKAETVNTLHHLIRSWKQLTIT